MDKKAVALSGLSALLLASTSSGDAEAQQKLIAPSTSIPKMTVSPSPNNAARAIDTQRSKSINQASPAAANKLIKSGASSEPWLEHWAQAHTSATNPVGNIQKTLKQQ
jgi:hypothetical protein